jgi:predicted AlkP superfamily phosphohydrolase/phosphomutase
MMGSPCVVLFGLDGATFEILDDLVDLGVMPNLGRFFARGVRRPLLSTVPPLTPLAWTTAITGRSPGNHGILGFFQHESPESASLRIVSARELRVETIWSMVNRHGYRSGCLNFPIHSPPPRIDGYVIPGWLPWRWLKRFSHPPGLLDALLEQIPGLDPKTLAMDFEEEKKSIAGAVLDNYEAWIELHLKRDCQWFQVFRQQLLNDPVALSGIVFDGVDKLQHLLWPYLSPKLREEELGTEYERTRALCFAYFRQIDQFLGETIDYAGPGAQIFVISDHGFTVTEKIFFVNHWLEQQGYLVWKKDAEFVEDTCHELEPDFYQLSAFDMSRTCAYALTASSNGIHIAVKGKRGSEGIPPGHYEGFRLELIERLLHHCKDPETGQPLIRRVWTREEAFAGPAMPLAPDLTVELCDYGFFSVRRSRALVVTRPQPMGTHHPEGVFAAAGLGIRSGVQLSPARLLDVTPTILAALGLATPEDLEGTPLQDIFCSQTALKPFRPRPTASLGTDDITPPPDDPEVLERLRALGYIE